MKKNQKVLDIYRIDLDYNTPLELPLAEDIRAGFASPATEYECPPIDLNKELVRHPEATFYGRVNGDSMVDAGISDGDILVIDKLLEPYNGAVAVCIIDGEFTVKYIQIEKDVIWLVPANDSYKAVKVTEENSFMIWGIVTYSIKNHTRKKT